MYPSEKESHKCYFSKLNRWNLSFSGDRVPCSPPTSRRPLPAMGARWIQRGLGPARRLEPDRPKLRLRTRHIVCVPDRVAGRPRGRLRVWGLHGPGGNCLTPGTVCRWRRLRFGPSGLRSGTGSLGSHHRLGAPASTLPRRCPPFSSLAPLRSAAVCSADPFREPVSASPRPSSPA